MLKQSIIDKLEKLSVRVKELSRLLAEPEITKDIAQYTKLNKEYAELQKTRLDQFRILV